MSPIFLGFRFVSSSARVSVVWGRGCEREIVQVRVHVQMQVDVWIRGKRDDEAVCDSHRFVCERRDSGFPENGFTFLISGSENARSTRKGKRNEATKSAVCRLSSVVDESGCRKR